MMSFPEDAWSRVSMVEQVSFRFEVMPRVNDNNRKWWILAAMGGVLGLILLDETVVGVALPTIREDLGCPRWRPIGGSTLTCSCSRAWAPPSVCRHDLNLIGTNIGI
jgi:hypothetical protein